MIATTFIDIFGGFFFLIGRVNYKFLIKSFNYYVNRY